jgi:hypothetical protein
VTEGEPIFRTGRIWTRFYFFPTDGRGVRLILIAFAFVWLGTIIIALGIFAFHSRDLQIAGAVPAAGGAIWLAYKIATNSNP